MKVRFRSNQLRRCYEDENLAYRAWGRAVGEQYLNKVTRILDAPALSDLFDLRSLRLHPLRGGRQGQYAMTLVGRWRLIISVAEDETIVIEEVSNHYDQ